MLAVERLIEALEESDEWWNEFDSFEEILKIIGKASKEQNKVTNEQIQILVDYLQDDDILLLEPVKTYRKCLLVLRKRLESVKELNETAIPSQYKDTRRDPRISKKWY